MREQTMTSDEARRHWGEMLESALRGTATIITRRGRRIAVVLSYDLWLTLGQDAGIGSEIRQDEQETGRGG